MQVFLLVSRAVWRQRNFGLLWGGQTVSEIGSAVTTLALPTLAIFAFHAGPAAVGLMVASERLPFPIVALFAGAIVDRVRRRPSDIVSCRRCRRPSSPAAEVGEGLRHVFGIPVLRAQLLCMSAAIVFAHAYEAPLYVFAYDRLHLSPGLLGAMLASQGLGAVVGSVVGSRIIAWVGVGRTVAVGNGLAIAVIALLPLAVYVPPATIMFPVFIVGGVLGTAGDLAQVTPRQALSPARLLGRMSAVFRTFYWGAWPLGNLLGGLLAAAIGPSATLWITALLGALAFLSIRFTPLWRVRDFPATSPASLEPPLEDTSAVVP